MRRNTAPIENQVVYFYKYRNTPKDEIPVVLNFFMFMYLFLRETEPETERQSTSRGGAEREGDTASEAGSRLRAVNSEPDAGLKLVNCEIMT